MPRYVEARSGRWVLNPGSVGLPAFSDDAPYPHAMETGSPHARYAVLEQTADQVRVALVAVRYDVAAAVRAARARGRPAWARWLEAGRAP